MYLINVRTYLLEHFVDVEDCPDYAALSHRWGTTKDELTFHEIEIDVITERTKQKPGWKKLVRSCQAAKKLDCEWIWIDTCCIDKKSSAELQEAINSMWNIYSGARVCLAYLNDVQYSPDSNVTVTNLDVLGEQGFPAWLVQKTFETSEWFTRGWTLQELLAPQKVVFFTPDWRPFGTRHGLSQMISRTTSIPENCLRSGSWREGRIWKCSTMTKLSWAARRKTKRIEDRAYSLFGLFAIQMPLIYGEGQNAFKRFQKQLLEESEDATLLLWQQSAGSAGFGGKNTGPFADSPADFAGVLSFPIDSPTDSDYHPWTLTNLGLALTREVTYVSTQVSRHVQEAIVWLGIMVSPDGGKYLPYGREVFEICPYRSTPHVSPSDSWKKSLGLLACTSGTKRGAWNVEWALHVEIDRDFKDGVIIVWRIRPLCIATPLSEKSSGLWTADDRVPRKRMQVVIARRQRIGADNHTLQRPPRA